MPHYSVLVVGDDVDVQLAPYNEALKGPSRKVRVSEDLFLLHGIFAGLGGDEVKKLWHGTAKEVKEHLRGWMQCESGEVGSDSEGIYYLSTSNPVGKWDWHREGGRFEGFFQLKVAPEGSRRASSGRKGEIGQPITVPDALVRDGEWHDLFPRSRDGDERDGDGVEVVGYWSSSTIAAARTLFDELLADVSDDVQLTIVDCHS